MPSPLLKRWNRSVSSSTSRPRTPPTLSPPPRNNAPSPSRLGASTSNPSSARQPYPSLAKDPLKAWVAEEEDDDDGEVATEYTYNNGDDEDEFGLPSIVAKSSNARSGKGGKTESKIATYQPSADHRSFLNTNLSPGRARANSSDIAEERGAPSYPTARKTEGKILRPQYKDILRGL